MFKWLFGNNSEYQIKVLDDTFFNIQDINGQRNVYINPSNKINIEKVIIIKFGTENCPACKMFREPLKEFERKNKENIETYEVDLNNNEELGNLLNIRGVPTNFIFVKGKLFDISIGASLVDIVIKLKPLKLQIK